MSHCSRFPLVSFRLFASQCGLGLKALCPGGRGSVGGWGGWHEATVLVCAFGGAYWPLALAHSDPLWVRTCFGCVNGASTGGGEGGIGGSLPEDRGAKASIALWMQSWVCGTQQQDATDAISSSFAYALQRW